MKNLVLQMTRVLCFSLVTLFASGCSTTRSRLTALPFEQTTVIGGGFGIESAAPGDGTVYLVDTNTGTVVLSRTVKRGETIDIDDTEFGVMKELGLDISTMAPVLYFVPDEPPRDSE